jgi:hypothetical protein
LRVCDEPDALERFAGLPDRHRSSLSAHETCDGKHGRHPKALQKLRHDVLPILAIDERSFDHSLT